MNTRLIPSRSYPDNIVSHLRNLALERPSDTALIVVNAQSDKLVERRFGYFTLDLHVRSVAAVLQKRYTKGERVLLLMENDEHYAIGFLACLYAGMIAVPVFPPELIRERHLARLLAIAADAKARSILTTSEVLPLLDGVANTQLAKAEILTVDSILQSTFQVNEYSWQERIPEGDEIAFLQYTSGSTSTPKGVMVSHHNLIINARAFEEGMSIGEDDIFVSWLPLYHDMGLIGGLIQPLHRGVPVILMAPQHFIERPVRWLEIISRYRATVSGAPNFAFQLCVERVKNAQLQELDLSTWRVAFSGAEPVRRDTMCAFIERFSAVGFSAGTIYPCYGLAEATLFVTGGVRGEGMIAHEFSSERLAQGQAEIVARGIPIVACGFPASNHAIRIIDPEKQIPLADGQVGEIWTEGPSLAGGYWQRPRETAEAFIQYQGARWLRTGDLGFIYAHQLYIMGRLKDLIIIRGQNVYPHDIELVIEEEVEAVRKGRVAAFSVEHQAGEGIGIAVEVSRKMQKLVPPEALVTVLSESVSASCHESLSVVVLLNPGALPKTSSGKLQRTACRQGWRERTLDAYAIYEYGRFVLGGSKPLTSMLEDETDLALATIWEAVLHRTGFQPEDHFFAIGGNSLSAVQVVARIADRWQIPFLPRSLFRCPRLHECASEIKRLVSSKTDSSKVETTRLVPIRDAVHTLPLSYGQQRLWFLWQLDPASTAYHVQHAIRLSGLLDRQAFYASFQDLHERHESLRTNFQIHATGTVEQVIQPASRLAITEVDLYEWDVDRREDQAAEEAQRIVSLPFDLTQDPLLRVALIRLTDQEHIVFIVMHHIISDGVSIQILLNELAACYQAHAYAKPACLANLPVQYGDYAVWQQKWLEAGEKARQLAYWRNYLGDVHPILRLPTDRPRQPVTQYPAARYRFEVPQAVLTQLRQLALGCGATLFMTLLVALQVLLFRHTGQQVVRVGVPIANRNRIETTDLIGFFVNTQVLQCQMHGRMPLAELLARVRDDAINAQSHQDLPFEQLVEALHPQRDLHQNPLFQITLNYLQKDYRLLQQFSGLAVADYALPEQAAQLELRLETVELPDGSVSASFVYASNLFDAASIERLTRHYQQILHVLATQSSTAIGDIDLLDKDDKRQLANWGGAVEISSLDHAVHRLIERQAERCPQMTAVISDHSELSYAELNHRANKLAHRLIGLGVKPETPVGIAIERNSVDLIVGLLAILKAGGGYVPLDPEYPGDRLNYLIEDSGVQLLLTQSHLRALLPCHQEVTILEIDRLDLSAGNEINPEIALHGDSLAYVIYTSGSTGRPKGVAVAHGPLAMHLSAIKKIYAVQQGDRELMFFSMNFDAAAEQWMGPLTEGATLVLSSNQHLTGEGFTDLIERHKITILHLPPAYLRLLLPQIEQTRQWVRSCIAGGEAWYAADVIAARKLFPQARLVNAYGPTETVITPTAWFDQSGESALKSSMGEFAPIGRSVGVRNLYVLDAELNLVPPGSVGELYIGGAGLARGYLDRPAQTSERFVADPFDQAGGRLYRTGDLVRWRGDGQLEYLGRIDDQIKLRGFRVELGEIEARLLAQTEVREAAVIAREGRHGLRLLAYIAPHDGMQLSASLLKTALAATLPDYMIPSQFIILDRLPLNPNGKIDRKALPIPEQFDTSDYDPPVNMMEKTIAEIWAETLEMPQVGMHNNFFDLGGHSLLLIKIKQKLEARLSRQIAMVDLFKYTTVASLAKFLSEGETGPASLSRHRARAQRQRSAFIQRKQERIN
ncbi:non-ribosomal peptide synthetase [Nitrosomonas halophila]|uniref:Amino acid adenylation domain-containing protein n=1 Tax=Nitrosomonas halophila TaxID=44576 RepID=A0A1H3MER8_9PROT|nr:non-ribosomal peptide synthetase [Nitrosomonas halophila]SDY74818.1 amino acid adenylation domain-containing protein [Nitrosomonas halophila]